MNIDMDKIYKMCKDNGFVLKETYKLTKHMFIENLLCYYNKKTKQWALIPHSLIGGAQILLISYDISTWHFFSEEQKQEFLKVYL